MPTRKLIVRDFLKSLETGDPAPLKHASRYIALQHLAIHGSAIVYHKIHKVLGEGNFVLTASEGTLGRKPTAYDLFRVADGRIVEHWDVLDTIPPRESWANPNGKF